MIIKHVPLTHCAQTWKSVEKYFESALKHGHGDYTLDQIKTFINIGQWLLLVAVDEENNIYGASSVSFINFPNDRAAFITFIGGKLISSQETFKQLKDILISFGATKIQGMARPSVARLWKRYGFNERTTLVEVKL